MSVHSERRARRPGRTWALVGAGLQLCFATGLAVLRDTNASVGERRAEGMLPTLALAAVFAAPAVLALVGVVIDRPVLFGAAAIASLPAALISIAAFPVLIPAGLLLVAYVQATSTHPSSTAVSTLVVFGTFAGLVLLALAIMLSGKGTYTYAYPDGGSEGGEYYLPGHAALALGILVGGVVLTTAIASRFAKAQ